MASFRISQNASVSIETNLSSVNNSSAQLSVDAMCLNSKLSMIPDDVYSFSSEETKLTDLQDEQNEKYPTFTTFNTEIETFINSAMTIDSDVAELINGMKETFYSNHEYLRPESEKPWYQRAWEWCKDHAWEVITVIVVIVAIVGIICLCFIPGVNIAVGALLLAGAINAVANLAIKLVLDVVLTIGIGIVTGEWKWRGGNWADYLACGVANFMTGMMTLIPGLNLTTNFVGPFAEKFLGNALNNMFYGTDYSLGETFGWATVDGIIGVVTAGWGDDMSKGLRNTLEIRNMDDLLKVLKDMDLSDFKFADFAEWTTVFTAGKFLESLPKFSKMDFWMKLGESIE